MRLCLLACALLAAMSVSAAREADLLATVAEITGYGVFQTSSATRIKAATGRMMAADSVTGVRFGEYSNEIPAILGTNFGLNYTINSTPRGQTMRVRSIIRFPEPGLVTPRGKVYTESVEHKNIKIGQTELHGYGFDEPWEIVPGEWVFEVWYRDTRMIRKTFTVVPADEE